MKLDNNELHKLLADKNISLLHHANTIATTITFIENGGLLSRESVEKSGLYQTEQSSDEKDKSVGVYNDVFLDSTDLHTYFNRQNKYGPVTFKFSTDFLKNEDLEIWVTKNNPIYWTQEMTDKEKYFESVEDLRQNWSNYERQKKMITIRNPNRPILFPYIDRIVVDNPQVSVSNTGLVYFQQAVEGLKKSYAGNENIRNKFITRECEGCYCRKNYLQELSIQQLNKLFLPKK